MITGRNEVVTVNDFLALDRENLDQKYEFRNGQMMAMPGGSTNHTLIIANLSGILYAHLRKSSCAFLPEGTLKIEDECYLPDIMVTCNEKDLTENKTYIEYPKLVIEVLSPSTETNNRRDKLLAYTQCLSIQEYVLVNWDCMLIEKMTRKGTEELDSIQWTNQWYGKGETLELETIGLSIPVEDVYERAILPPSNPIKIYKRRRTILQ
ncbi:MAG TPA: Uma2 family endonuclease [Ktedonobacteraceae bacterium]|nr:Uma2 family endonuclease [Ktedonobacteraceae bacterium]